MPYRPGSGSGNSKCLSSFHGKIVGLFSLLLSTKWQDQTLEFSFGSQTRQATNFNKAIQPTKNIQGSHKQGISTTLGHAANLQEGLACINLPISFSTFRLWESKEACKYPDHSCDWSPLVCCQQLKIKRKAGVCNPTVKNWQRNQQWFRVEPRPNFCRDCDTTPYGPIQYSQHPLNHTHLNYP